jgi:hypothetical protein
MATDVIINGVHFQITRSENGALNYHCKLCDVEKSGITSDELLGVVLWNDEHQLEHEKPAR